MDENKEAFTHIIQTVDGIRHSGCHDKFVADTRCRELNGQAEKMSLDVRYEVLELR